MTLRKFWTGRRSLAVLSLILSGTFVPSSLAQGSGHLQAGAPRRKWPASAASLKKRLTELTAEAANNESILKRTQARELSLLRADGLPQLLHALVDGLRESYSLDAVSVVLLDPQHEIRHLLVAGGDRPEEFKQIFFVDSLISLAPQLAALHKPWLGPFVGATIICFSRAIRT